MISKKKDQKFKPTETSEWEVLVKDDIEEFVGYNTTEVEVIITKYRSVVLQKILYQLVFNVTPFYAEGGASW